MTDGTAAAVQTRLRGIAWGHLVVALALAILPAFGAYMIVSLSLAEPRLWILPAGILVFGYAIYGPDTVTAQIGATLFWLSIDSFLAPLAIGALGATVASQQSGVAAIGAGIGAGLMFVVTWVLAWTVGLVLFLLARRFEGKE